MHVGGIDELQFVTVFSCELLASGLFTSSLIQIGANTKDARIEKEENKHYLLYLSCCYYDSAILFVELSSFS